MPDIFSFGPYFVLMLLGLYPMEDHSHGQPSMASIPDFVHVMYQVTHSLVIYAVVIAILVLLGRRAWVWLTLGWPLHILVDMPTHTQEFFSTPFLWPLSDFSFNGISWSNPWIFIPNVIVLAGIYGHWYLERRRAKKN